jgi:hypothetical protein
VLQEGLGHRTIQNTTRYAELTARWFRDIWQRENGRRQRAQNHGLV